VFNVFPYPDESFPATALFDFQIDEIAEVNPTRTEFDNPVEEKPDPNIVMHALPLDGRFENEVGDMKPGTTVATSNDPHSTPTAALTIALRTSPNPAAALIFKELSENQLHLSDEVK